MWIIMLMAFIRQTINLFMLNLSCRANNIILMYKCKISKQITKFKNIFALMLLLLFQATINEQNRKPDELKFVRQGVQRMIFDENQSIPLAKLHSDKIIGLEAMHPITNYSDVHANVSLK